ncbi:actin family [Spinellus fusiger]|nr:actin family [Spinellus fusiger]
MALALREENFVVIDVGSFVTRAGMSVNDTNKPPPISVFMSEFENPIQDNRIVSWAQLEASWHHILFKELQIKKSRNESPVLLTVPAEWTKEEYERITQIFFENFNVPGLYIAPQPLLALYGCGSVSGVIVDIGNETTDVNVVVDSILQTQSSISLPLGGKHLDQYLLSLLQQDPVLLQQIEQAPEVTLDLAFARFVREQPGACLVLVGHVQQEEVAVVETPTVTEAPATAAVEEFIDGEVEVPEDEPLPTVTEHLIIDYKGHKFTVGGYRHNVCDPLFMPELVGADSLSLADATRMAIMNCETPEIRPKLWENIVLTGGCSLIHQLQNRVKKEVQLSLPFSDNAGDSQPRLVSFLRIPEYFTVLKEKQYQCYATWLGGSIVAKLVFIDAKNYVSKVDYNESGPSIVHTKSY